MPAIGLNYGSTVPDLDDKFEIRSTNIETNSNNRMGSKFETKAFCLLLFGHWNIVSNFDPSRAGTFGIRNCLVTAMLFPISTSLIRYRRC
jgi:hypothetical protein